MYLHFPSFLPYNSFLVLLTTSKIHHFFFSYFCYPLYKIYTHTQSAVSTMYYSYVYMFRADCLGLDNLPEGYTLEKTDFPFLCNHQLLEPLHLGLRVL